MAELVCSCSNESFETISYSHGFFLLEVVIKYIFYCNDVVDYLNTVLSKSINFFEELGCFYHFSKWGLKMGAAKLLGEDEQTKG
jgi:hypothetical protein